MSNSTDGLDGVLNDAATRRLSSQLTRAYRGTYGAQAGLRMIVRSLARQMIRAGVSPESVSHTFEGHVLNHPACQHARRNALTGKLDSITLVELTHDCVVEVAHETEIYHAPS